MDFPDNLSELSVDELNELHAEALAEFDETVDASDSHDADTLATLRELADGIKGIKGEIEAREAIDQEVADLADQVHADDPDDEADDTEAVDEDDDVVDADADDTDEPVEAVDDEDDSDDGDMVVDDDTAEAATDAATQATDEPTEDPAQEPTPVAASSSPSAAAINKNRGDDTPSPDEATKARKPAVIHAAANLSSFSTGQPLTMADVTDAFTDRLKGFPKGGSNSPRTRVSVASIAKPFREDEVVPRGEDLEPYAARVANEGNLPGKSLTAAGTWCAPSENIYDLCEMESTDGLLSLPSLAVNRGGIKHTLGPDFRAIYDSTGFNFTEAEAGEGNYDGEGGNKPCVEVPCPEFTEDRLKVAGLCITSDILQDTAYPELRQRFVEGSLVGHEHRLNALKIDEIVSGSTAVSPTGFGSATTSLLSAVDIQVEDMKSRNRMARSTSLELVLPFWARGVIRADLSNRLGIDLLNVSDSMIDGWFRDRDANPQYVYDWQDDLHDGASGFGSTNPQADWPDTIEFLLYPAGTWVSGESDVITLDAIYDSNNLPGNNFTALFTEEGYLIAKRCHDSRVVTVTDYNCFGDTAAGTACA